MGDTQLRGFKPNFCEFGLILAMKKDCLKSLSKSPFCGLDTGFECQISKLTILWCTGVIQIRTHFLLESGSDYLDLVEISGIEPLTS